jgi:hypothetical protein
MAADRRIALLNDTSVYVGPALARGSPPGGTTW